MIKEDYEKQFQGWTGDEESIKIEQAKLKGGKNESTKKSMENTKVKSLCNL